MYLHPDIARSLIELQRAESLAKAQGRGSQTRRRAPQSAPSGVRYPGRRLHRLLNALFPSRLKNAASSASILGCETGRQ
jgi:hypothetical protein